MSLSIEEQQRNEINRLNCLVSKLSSKKEKFYQDILEHRYNAAHQKTSAGITDLTNDSFHAEIKNWENYRESIGQLMLYNMAMPRNILKVFVFGKRPSPSKMENILNLHRKLGIELIELDIDGNEEKLIEINEDNNDIDPYEQFIDEFLKMNVDKTFAIGQTELNVKALKWFSENCELIFRKTVLRAKLESKSKTLQKNVPIVGQKGFTGISFKK